MHVIYGKPRAHSSLRAKMAGYLYKGKRKLRVGEVRTTELYYKHRVFPGGFSRLRRV